MLSNIQQDFNVLLIFFLIAAAAPANADHECAEWMKSGHLPNTHPNELALTLFGLLLTMSCTLLIRCYIGFRESILSRENRDALAATAPCVVSAGLLAKHACELSFAYEQKIKECTPTS